MWRATTLGNGLSVSAFPQAPYDPGRSDFPSSVLVSALHAMQDSLTTGILGAYRLPCLVVNASMASDRNSPVIICGLFAAKECVSCF